MITRRRASAMVAAWFVLTVLASTRATTADTAETGWASYYGPGSGVAMPFCTWTLRTQSGCGWVAVTSLQTGIRVVAPVVDYCECVVPGSGHPERIVDLQWGVLEALGLNPEAGVYHVQVERLASPAMPNTAAAL